MPPTKAIRAEGTARQRLEAKKVMEEANGMTAQQEQELEAAKQAAKEHAETGQVLIDRRNGHAAPKPEPEASLPVLTMEPKPEPMPLPEPAPGPAGEPTPAPPQLADLLNEIQKPFKFKIAGGRVIEMAPPSMPYELIMPKMFESRKELDLETRSHMQMGKILNYVRSIDGVKQPAYLEKWEQVLGLAMMLGTLGLRAVYDVYSIRWPDSGETLWQALGN